MTKLPEGYSIFFNEDHLELYAPDGRVIGYYLGTEAQQVAADAFTHKALNNECLWGPDCPVCEDRRRRARRGLAKPA